MMDWAALRRIITTNDDGGRSHILIDGAPARLVAVEEAGLAEIWTAALGADCLRQKSDCLADEEVCLEPAPGAVKIRWFTVAPENPAQTPEEREAAAAFAFAAVDAASARVDTSRHPMMHKTNTLDVIILVKGEVELLLDDGPPARMKPGDVVVQRATNHAWVNRGSETALLVAVLMSAEKTKTAL